MAIEVARGVVSRIRERSDGFVLQVRGAADPAAATAALERAGDELYVALEGAPSLYTQPLPAPEGPWIYIDAADAPARLLRTVPAVIARLLEQEGVSDAVIASPPPFAGPLLPGLNEVARAVVLRLYPPPPPATWPPSETSRLPEGWLAAASSWVSDGLDGAEQLLGAIEMIDFSLSARDAHRFLEQARTAGAATSLLVAGDLDTQIRAVNGCFSGWEHNLALAAGGPAASDAQLLAHFERLRELARSLAPQLAYALISIEDTFNGCSRLDHYAPWDPLKANRDWIQLYYLLDEIVIEAFPYQILGPRHLERLTPTPAHAHPLPGGRTELALGDPHSWLPTHPHRQHTIDTARTTLAPCLMTNTQQNDLFWARRDQHQASAP